MRYGVAIDLHSTAENAVEVSWPSVLEQVLAAEKVGVDLVVLPDHLSYRAAGDGDYARPDEPVGVRESVTTAAALAASTSRIGIGHSVINVPYRSPAMLAHVAAGSWSPRRCRRGGRGDVRPAGGARRAQRAADHPVA